MGNRILLLDACRERHADLSAQLAHCGFVVRVAEDIDGAIRLLQEDPPAGIVLNGEAASVEHCRALCAQSSAPVVVIGAKLDEDLVVGYFEAGAEQVLAGPVSRRELEARIRALLGRRNGRQPGQTQRRVYRLNGLVIDTDAHVVNRDGRALSLTPTEFRLLVALARRAGKVASHAELLSEVWGASFVASPRVLRPHIGFLRRKLGYPRNQSGSVVNQRGVGYRLDAEGTPANGRGTNGYA